MGSKLGHETRLHRRSCARMEEEEARGTHPEEGKTSQLCQAEGQRATDCRCVNIDTILNVYSHASQVHLDRDHLPRTPQTTRQTTLLLAPSGNDSPHLLTTGRVTVWKILLILPQFLCPRLVRHARRDGGSQSRHTCRRRLFLYNMPVVLQRCEMVCASIFHCIQRT